MQTPVAFIIFNRPDTTQRVFSEIRRVRPASLYLIADGPRTEEEKALTDATRAIVSLVDWDCRVHKIYSEENLGCRTRVITGLNEVFTFEEEAIILEDDCLADPSFFTFCETLIGRYRYHDKVMHIGGNNFQMGALVGSGDYYFSGYSHIWGWATWARAWKMYRSTIAGEQQLLNHAIPAYCNYDAVQVNYWQGIYQGTLRPGYSAWSYHWLFAIWLLGGKCIVPNKNLVKNIGFGTGATHTSGEPGFYKKIILESLENFAPPVSETIDIEADSRTFYTIFYSEPKKYSLYDRAKNKLKKWLGWSK